MYFVWILVDVGAQMKDLGASYVSSPNQQMDGSSILDLLQICSCLLLKIQDEISVDFIKYSSRMIADHPSLDIIRPRYQIRAFNPGMTFKYLLAPSSNQTRLT